MQKTRVRSLTASEIASLNDVLLRAKQRCLGDNCPNPTPKEMGIFLKDVFDMWASGEYHALPDANSITTGMKDKTVAIGTLDEDVPSSEEIRTELKRRGVSGKVTKNRAYKHLHNDYAIRTTQVSRMRGATVCLRVTLKNGHEVNDLHLLSCSYAHILQVNTQLVTDRGIFLSPTVKMTYFAGLTERRAYLNAFRAYDRCEMTKINPYNLDVAVFIARNRITSWANTAESGAGFLHNSNRLNVISMRASDYFIVIGNIATGKKPASSRVVEFSGGSIDDRVLPQWLVYFEKH